ncbi:MAG: carbohydrate ABC transporter substrate-binding protein, partial [Anaerolineae bacterium]
FITGFITEQYPDLVAGEDYNFFEFPPIDPAHGQPLLVAGDLFGMFNDTPQARALMQYLVTADAQAIWAERGGFLSANKMVDPAVYPDQLTQQIGEMLTQATAVRFDASDLMPEAVNNAFWSGIMDFVSQPDSLDSILESIESAAQDAY